MSQEEELSLRALTEAFQEAMGRAGLWTPAESEGSREVGAPEAPPKGEDQPPRSGDSGENLPISPTSSLEPQAPEPLADPVEITPRSILEALLFVGDPQNRPIQPEMAASLMRNVRPDEIPELVRQLNAEYQKAGCPYHIVWEGGGYRMELRKPFWHLRHRLYARLRETKLSQAAVDVLAIVAYQQPITAEQVQQLRGKPSGHILSQLVQRQLLRTERAQDGSRKAYYYTTERFLALFGLESLDELPQTEDIEKK